MDNMARFETGKDGKVFIKSGGHGVDGASSGVDSDIAMELLKFLFSIIKWSFYIAIPVVGIYGLFTMPPTTIIVVLLLILILK